MGLANQGYHVFIACRSQRKAQQAISYLRQQTNNPKIEFLPLNLASLASVRHCVNLFLDRNLPLHVLVNNAGIFDQRGVTEEGFELIWGTNYLGHFLLTYLLLEKLQASAPSRIINLSSDLALKPTQIQWDLFVKPTRLNFIESYNQSKLCLLLLNQYLSQQFPNITVNAIHPGFVHSNITWGHRLCKYLGLGVSPEKGAYSSIVCASSPDFKLVTGQFLDRKAKAIKLPKLAQDQELCQTLWERSLQWTGGKYSPPKQQIIYDGKDEVWGTYALSLTPEAVSEISHRILKRVLKKPPIKTLTVQFFKALFQLQFGSILLIIVQCYKRQFYMERHLDSSEIWQLCQDPNLLKILTQYLGEDIKLWRSELWANYPAHQVIPFWHQDIYPNLLLGEGKSISVYIGLTEVTANNGFEYIPKPLTQSCQIQITDPFSGNHFFKIPNEIQQQAIPIILQPGEFVLFTDQVIHRSVYNQSGKTRLALTLRVAAGEIKILPGYSPNFHPPVALLKVQTVKKSD